MASSYTELQAYLPLLWVCWSCLPAPQHPATYLCSRLHLLPCPGPLVSTWVCNMIENERLEFVFSFSAWNQCTGDSSRGPSPSLAQILVTKGKPFHLSEACFLGCKMKEWWSLGEGVSQQQRSKLPQTSKIKVSHTFFHQDKAYGVCASLAGHSAIVWKVQIFFINILNSQYSWCIQFAIWSPVKEELIQW